MKNARYAALLLALVPGCDCRVTKVTYGSSLPAKTQDELAVLLKRGLSECVKNGESDACISEDNFFDDLKALGSIKVMDSCRAGEHAQLMAITEFAPAPNVTLIASIFSQDLHGNWVLEQVESKNILAQYRACEVFGEEWRHEEVEFQN